jgi:large subunit ribosomal protein L15
MILRLHDLRPAVGSTKRKKVIGRGNASGHGAYSTRGIKGQKARTGGRRGLKLMGVKSLVQSIAKKRGFHSLKSKYEIVNLDVLERYFIPGEKVDVFSLWKKGIVSSVASKVKLLGNGTVNKPFHVVLDAISEKAKKAIENAKGKAELRK